ncbi:MAG: phosphate acyltransferase PlsX [Kiritimatiellae bacterium]|nr:phosphate acyltransferase PlsX [Kiritimatiellia bacterium]
MRIAVDIMGGDYAPRETVRGCVEAAARIKELKGVRQIVMVGQEPAIRSELDRCGGKLGESLSIVHASETIGMEEAPAAAVRRKRDNSISRCLELLGDGEAQAMVSAGNSGAVSAAALFKLGRIKGVARPAIACVLPTRTARPMLLIDAGANTDCEAEWLVQFAIMGSVYSQAVLRRDKPSVGLLSIGTEDSKGNEMTKRAFSLLKQSGVNFRGNVEGHDLFKGETDVVVCDGFVGNVVLKTTESVAHAIGSWMKEEFVRHPIRMLGAMLLKGALKAMKMRMDPELYGGAVLLGVPGVCIVTHGASTHRAIFHAIRVGAVAIANDVSQVIASRIGGQTAATPAPAAN